MKKLFLFLLVIGLSLPGMAQNKSKDAVFYKSLSKDRSVHPTVKKASIGLYNNFTIRDSLLYYTRSFEKLILQGKRGGTIKPATVRSAMKKFPGNNYKAASQRLKLYATEGKGSPVSRTRRYRR